MKIIIALYSLLIFTGVIFAQQPVNYLLKAKAFLDYGKNKDAIALLSDGLVKNNKDYRFFLERAEGYMADGEYANAIKDLEAANSLTLSSGEFGLSKIFARKGDIKSSLFHLENNLISPFKKSEKEIMLDQSFSSFENTPEWRLFWKKERYNPGEEKISEIEYCISLGKTDDAVNLLNELSLENSKNTDLLYAEAMVDLSVGKYGECISLITKLLDSDKKNEKYLRLLAKAQLVSGNPSGASQTYSILLNNGAIDAGLFLFRADCYNKTGETEKALMDISAFLELYPDNKSALRLAGKTESRAGDNLKALDYFSQNLKLHPNDPECYIDRANSYLVSATWDNAISDYSMALDIQPANSETWLNKGIALINKGKPADACHDFNYALSLGNKKATSYISRYCIK
jgi:tetratricopeptide (TPR) repeat protein